MLGLPANSFKQTDSGAVRFQSDCVIHFIFHAVPSPITGSGGQIGGESRMR